MPFVFNETDKSNHRKPIMQFSFDTPHKRAAIFNVTQIKL